MKPVKETLKDLRDLYTSVRVSGKQKVFCIGLNKTGTTSLQQAFRQLGFVTGDQKRAERLLPSYRAGDFAPIVAYCRTAQVFQDFPFSYPDTYKHLDAAFPGSIFILSVRDSADQWYESMANFHRRMFGKGELPTANDLRNATYVHRGWAWEVFRLFFGDQETNLYERNRMVAAYQRYNDEVRSYFKGRPSFLEINLSEPDAYRRFCSFLHVTPSDDHFPWENKTEDLATRQ